MITAALMIASLIMAVMFGYGLGVYSSQHSQTLKQRERDADLERAARLTELASQIATERAITFEQAQAAIRRTMLITGSQL